MKSKKSDRIVLSPSPDDGIDYDAVNEWVNAKIDAQVERDNQRFAELFELEKALALPLEEKARAQGLLPSGPEFEAMLQWREAEAARWSEEEERPDADDQVPGNLYGTLPQALHGRPQTNIKTRPFTDEDDDQKDGGTNKSFADKGNGAMDVRPSTSFSGDWDWARCSLAQKFEMRSHHHTVEPTCRFMCLDRADVWGLVSNSTVELDLLIFTFNITQNQEWMRRMTLATLSNMWVGMVGLNLGLTGIVTRTGYGNADLGDQLLITATIIGRAKAPTGHASLEFKGTLLSMSIS